ncbi:MAG: hypothetical protein NVSMB56_05560 [Pyrinomonadaceae bacterium]
MPKKSTKNSPKTERRTRTKSLISYATLKKADDSSAPENSEASERFVKDILVRGEAAKPTRGAKLPSDATHVITKENSDGTAEIKRVRYKTF